MNISIDPLRPHTIEIDGHGLRDIFGNLLNPPLPPPAPAFEVSPWMIGGGLLVLYFLLRR